LVNKSRRQRQFQPPEAEILNFVDCVARLGVSCCWLTISCCDSVSQFNNIALRYGFEGVAARRFPPRADSKMNWGDTFMKNLAKSIVVAVILTLALTGCRHSVTTATVPQVPPAQAAAPVASLTVSPATVEPGQSAQLSWNNPQARGLLRPTNPPAITCPQKAAGARLKQLPA
jgi:hypothetical protein